MSDQLTTQEPAASGFFIARTRDMALVKSILSHPKILPHIGEDGADPGPLDHDGLHWLLVSDPEPAGVFLLHARTSVCMEMHTCLLPRIWGKGANQAAQLLLARVFGAMGVKKLVTSVPVTNRAALRFAKAHGLQVEGTNRASYLKHGQLVDQIELGITLKEWEQCQQFSL